MSIGFKKAAMHLRTPGPVAVKGETLPAQTRTHRAKHRRISLLTLALKP